MECTSNERKASRPAVERRRKAESRAQARPARFSCLYEGEDKRLCVFETHDGHLVSVRASRLA